MNTREFFALLRTYLVFVMWWKKHRRRNIYHENEAEKCFMRLCYRKKLISPWLESCDCILFVPLWSDFRQQFGVLINDTTIYSEGALYLCSARKRGGETKYQLLIPSFPTRPLLIRYNKKGFLFGSVIYSILKRSDVIKYLPSRWNE